MTQFLRRGLLVVALALPATVGLALEQKPVLDLATARMIAEGCFAHQATAGPTLFQVAVADDGGNLILLMRQDGACKACGDIATAKARTSALYGLPTGMIEMLAYGENREMTGAPMPGLAMIPGTVAFPGGLPIAAGGVTIGGVGVSGGSSAEDAACAAAGLAAAAATLAN